MIDSLPTAPYDGQPPNINKKLTIAQQAKIDRGLFEAVASGRFHEPYQPPFDGSSEPPVQTSRPESSSAPRSFELAAEPTPDIVTHRPEHEDPEDRFSTEDLAQHVKDNVIPKLHNWYSMELEKIEIETLVSFFNGISLARERLSEEEGKSVSDAKIYSTLNARLAELAGLQYETSAIELEKMKQALRLMEALMNGYTKNGRLPRTEDILRSTDQ